MSVLSRPCIRIAAAALLSSLVPLAAEAQGAAIPVGKYECRNGGSALGDCQLVR
ncbi:MAG TPA: hypothetical protein VMU06_17985 [Stellaceae bacterium]|nr:hypothetical protein [Stellaceae bacterium]